ncbi:putative DNA repair protein YkoV [Pelotomaculum schinkii]|uniref:Putative DNA repair protein YkoV n=1 Tax=Pelotomaculum schinkii TaxID=78350 RepID=A0A4Y7R9J3_9FIRM|nr:Ku protein [Pelotomaculum schinkii]TEB05456.1 putative DNA repair protein YkoV [Pelotomaculum schinkii]
MQAIWKGSISFGLVNIPVKVCGAVNANQVSFNQIHEPCKSRIKYRKYCPHCEKEVPAEEIIKGSGRTTQGY